MTRGNGEELYDTREIRRCPLMSEPISAIVTREESFIRRSLRPPLLRHFVSRFGMLAGTACLWPRVIASHTAPVFPLYNVISKVPTCHCVSQVSRALVKNLSDPMHPGTCPGVQWNRQYRYEDTQCTSPSIRPATVVSRSQRHRDLPTIGVRRIPGVSGLDNPCP